MVLLLFIDFLEEGEYFLRLGRMKNRLVSTFPFLHESNAEKQHQLREAIRREKNLFPFGFFQTALTPCPPCIFGTLRGTFFKAYFVQTKVPQIVLVLVILLHYC